MLYCPIALLFVLVANIVRVRDPHVIEDAVALLRRGELIVYPTDTVYGLGAAASNEEAIRRLYTIKGRSPEKAVPLLIAEMADVARIAEQPPLLRKLADRFWPGALTIVLPRRMGFRSLALANEATVALRIPDEDIVRDIVHTLGEAITGTSANRSGQAAPTSAAQAAMQLGDLIPLVIDGGTRRGGESTVIDITTTPARILREGAVKRAELESVLGKDIG
jgi:L-threonylcarbamoyladenylate synthase